jgi:alpha-galactosidase
LVAPTLKKVEGAVSATFVDVWETEDPHRTLTFRSGLVAYQESLVKGQWVGRSWNGAGYTNAEAERLDPAKHWGAHAFHVEVDGQLLHHGWEWREHRVAQDEHGLVSVVELRHARRPVTLAIHTRLDGTPMLARSLAITNTGDRPAALSAAMPWSGVLQTVDHQPLDGAPFEVGYMLDTHWGNEGKFGWQALPLAGYRIDGRYRRDRHRHPFFVVRNGRSGEHWVGTLAWSGGYAFMFDVDDGWERGKARLHFAAGPDAPAPLRVIAPGETITTPTMHLGLVIGDLHACVHALHDHIRTSVLPPQRPDRAGIVECGIGPEQEITYDLVTHELETGAAMGAELFFVDASWYSAPRSHWWNTVGDWNVGSRFPEGLAPIREQVHAKGMLWGLWMDAERIGSESAVAREHPDWFVRRYDDEPHAGGMLDLTNPAAARWMEAEIDRVITEHQLDFFRLDYNIGNSAAAGYHEQDGWSENVYWRYYEALYAIYERLRERHPTVIFENCASGGARTDLGMVRHFNHTWVTDWQVAPRSFSITNGMTMALPPERVDRLLGMGLWTHRAAELDFQARLLLFVHPTIGWFNMEGAAPNPAQVARVRHMLDIYKTFVRPMHAGSRIFHHTPVTEGFEPHGWGVLELASRERDRAVAGLFRLADPAEGEYLLRFRGLDRGRRYRVRLDNSGDEAELDGWTLAQTGITVRLDTPLTSELIIAEAVG